VVSVAAHEVAELPRQRALLAWLELHMPARILLPDQHAHFVGDVVEIVRHVNKADSLRVEPKRFDVAEFIADLFPRWQWPEYAGVVAPLQG